MFLSSRFGLVYEDQWFEILKISSKKMLLLTLAWVLIPFSKYLVGNNSKLCVQVLSRLKKLWNIFSWIKSTHNGWSKATNVCANDIVFAILQWKKTTQVKLIRYANNKPNRHHFELILSSTRYPKSQE